MSLSPKRDNPYAARSDEDSLAALTEKLSLELHSNIKSIVMCPPLTQKWNVIAGFLDRIATITEMEQKLPKDHENATIWETDELALRFLLEDGKMNLCLRLLNEYKDYQRNKINASCETKTDTEEKGGNHLIEKEQLIMMQKFERGVGLTLKNAWLHVEAVQTTDIPLLIEHISKVLSFATTLQDKLPLNPKGLLENLQESLVLHYLHAIFACSEDLAEDRFMPRIRQHSITPLIVKHLLLNISHMTQKDVIIGLEVLALIFSSEDFDAKPDKFFRTNQDRTNLIDLEDCVNTLTSQDTSLKRKLRPLMDQMKACSRQMKK